MYTYQSTPHYLYCPLEFKLDVGTFRRRRMWGESHYYLKDGSDITYRNPAIDVIVADYALRGQLEHEETLNHRAIASQRLTASDHDQAQCRETFERLEQARRNPRCQTGNPE